MRKVAVGIVMCVMLAACQQADETSQSVDGPQEKPSSPSEAVHQNDVINMHGEISNLNRFETFIANVKADKSDHIRVISYTTEGDPIFYLLDFDGKQIEYTFDNSQDGYAGSDKGQKSTTCKDITENATTNGTEYALAGCSSKVGDTFYFRIESKG
ncbi:DUF4362 domain-containing protein [Bacillus tianshenii]|nr:DUF4362 domain-containing protein [Bacillus tianshenii]